MKKLFTCLTSIALAAIMLFSFAGCAGLFGDDDDDSGSEPKTYTIQYTVDSGTLRLDVTQGESYSLDVVPQRFGYNFLGLYDAEVGGTQYVLASGSSVSPFTDGKNLVLFPQWAAKEYTVILDYQGAAVTGSRQLTVNYNASIPELPKNLTLQHSEFAGWYTEENCGGVQIADKFGIIPVVSVINENNFNLSTGNIYLYAGFELEKFTVTMYFEAGMNPEEIQVGYNTPIKEVVPKTRVGGKAPISWSKNQDGSDIFNGNITDNIVLYAVEYAPVIDFDENGGKNVTPIVAREGATISLPTPIRENYKFIQWNDSAGNKAEYVTMPSSSTTLTAVWHAKLVFDVNGGSAVEDVSAAAGNTITLPSPTRDGFIFAGWYTADKEEYTNRSMPSASLKLKAGWYKQNKVTINHVTGSSKLQADNTAIKLFNDSSLDFSSYLPASFKGTVNIDAYLNLCHSRASLSNVITYTLYFYSVGTISENNLLYSKAFSISSSSYERFTYSFSANISGNKIFGGVKVSQSLGYAYTTDYYYDLTYPDTTNLYL